MSNSVFNFNFLALIVFEIIWVPEIYIGDLRPLDLLAKKNMHVASSMYCRPCRNTSAAYALTYSCFVLPPLHNFSPDAEFNNARAYAARPKRRSALMSCYLHGCSMLQLLYECEATDDAVACVVHSRTVCN